MGGSKDSTYLDVKKALTKRFSPLEGWQCAWYPTYGELQPECVISRRVDGKTERVLVNVNMAPAVAASAVDTMMEQCRMLASKAIAVDKALLVVPSGADVSRVPEGIGVLEMGGWRVVGGRIAWAKNLERSAFVDEERQKRGLA
jgi:hypothetical protein